MMPSSWNPEAPWVLKIKELRKKEAAADAPTFLGIPERWYDDLTFRCVNGHVSCRYLKSELHGDLCLACGEYVMMTFPEDVEDAPPKPEGWPLPGWTPLIGRGAK
jgi:hypothetical protein